MSLGIVETVRECPECRESTPHLDASTPVVRGLEAGLVLAVVLGTLCLVKGVVVGAVLAWGTLALLLVLRQRARPVPACARCRGRLLRYERSGIRLIDLC